jgi:hypothetical protein
VIATRLVEATPRRRRGLREEEVGSVSGTDVTSALLSPAKSDAGIVVR